MNTVLKRNVPSDMPEMTAIVGEYYLPAAADDKMLIIVNASAAGLTAWPFVQFPICNRFTIVEKVKMHKGY